MRSVRRRVAWAGAWVWVRVRARTGCVGWGGWPGRIGRSGSNRAYLVGTSGQICPIPLGIAAVLGRNVSPPQPPRPGGPSTLPDIGLRNGWPVRHRHVHERVAAHPPSLRHARGRPRRHHPAPPDPDPGCGPPGPGRAERLRRRCRVGRRRASSAVRHPGVRAARPPRHTGDGIAPVRRGRARSPGARRVGRPGARDGARVDVPGQERRAGPAHETRRAGRTGHGRCDRGHLRPPGPSSTWR